MVGRKIYVEIGDSTVPVAIDEKTRAKDIKRQLGAEDYNLRVNDVTLSDNERILPLLREGSNTIRLLPPAIVGSKPFYFFEPGDRLAQEETLLRRRGFYRTKSGFTGLFVAGGKVYRMFVLIPETFPFSRPRIFVNDPSLAKLHECILEADGMAEIHFHEYSWNPGRHIVDLVDHAVLFLKSFLGERTKNESSGFLEVLRRWRLLP